MGLAMAHDSADPLEKIIPVGVVPGNFPALNPLNDNIMHRPRCINAGFARHEIQIAGKKSGIKY
jgi:hypothetical protein